MPDQATTPLRVDHTGYVENLGGEDPDDEWSCDSTRTTWCVNGVTIGRDHHGLALPGKVSQGDVVWLVSVVYSTGNSFANDFGANIEFITVHRDEATARANARSLASVDPDAGWGHQVLLRLDDGTPLPYAVPWLGYFESLDHVSCDRFVVGAENH